MLSIIQSFALTQCKQYHTYFSLSLSLFLDLSLSLPLSNAVYMLKHYSLLIILYSLLFHLRCLRKVLRVSWKEHVPNQEILRSAELTGIEAMLNQAQLRWSGHVTCMDDSRLPKQLFHAELSTGKRHKGGQRKRYKDVLKSTLKACNIPVDEWQALAQDRPAWRAATRKGTKHFERSRLQSLDDKRSARKNRVPNPSTAVPCQLCGKICASTFGLQAHMRKHQH